MELTKIKGLLEKYWVAETSIEEEKILYKYFNSNTVAPELEQYGILFEYYKEDKAKRLTSKLNIEVEKPKNNYLKYGVVASIILLVAVFVGKQEYNNYQQRKQFAEIKEALYLLSSNLNKGNDAVYAVSNNLSKGSDAVSKLNTYEITVNKVINKIND